MNVLSLFDGISCARVALERAGIDVEWYGGYEIDEYAIKISKKNYPEILRYGDVRKCNKEEKMWSMPFDGIDLLIGGSPCQDLSIANKARKGLSGERSGLFWEYSRILKEIKPRYFVLENVASMTDESKDTITKELGVAPIMIDAALVSPQNRKRLFWTNIPGITQPEDRNQIIFNVVGKSPRQDVTPKRKLFPSKNGVRWDTSGKGYFSQQDRAYSIYGKFPTIPTARTITKMKFYCPWDHTVRQMIYEDIEVMQGLPRGYTDMGKENRIEKRGGVIGNAFNVDVVVHILSFLQSEIRRNKN